MPSGYHKHNLDNFPNLRKRSRTTLSAEDEGIGLASRRARMISRALQRAQRRWDLYAAVVIAGQLDGEQSAKTKEWRLVIQNGRLLRNIRRLSIYTGERKHDDASRNRKVSMYQMQLHKGGTRRERYTGE